MGQSLELIGRFFIAYAHRDIDAVRATLDENAIWVFPGRNPLAGEKRGAQEIVRFFDEMGAVMARSNADVQVLTTADCGDYVLEYQHISASWEDGPAMGHRWCVLWKVENGKILEGRHFSENQYEADAFFSAHADA